MRQLTQNEIENAPRGAKFYAIGRSGRAYFYKEASGLKKPIPTKASDSSQTTKPGKS